NLVFNTDFGKHIYYLLVVFTTVGIPYLLLKVKEFFNHERFDGRGYPDGLKGENIPYLSRIIAIADTYDAMTSERPYRPALSTEIA
ncbi:MAG: hypothetical protein HY920_00330, partial [Elusimicrobia bacterium]|nr:hypothetical protein [Elusimicrobiota bacterium]